MPLGRPAPTAQTFPSMKSLLRWTKQVDLERKMKVPKKREIIA